MNDLIAWAERGVSSPVETAALFHLVFEDIRHLPRRERQNAGRIVMNFQLMSAGYPPISLKADTKAIATYYGAIDSFAQDIDDRDGSAMVDLVAHRLEDSVGKRMLQIEQTGA